MPVPIVDASKNSPSAVLMELVDIDHLSDFNEVVQFLTENLDKVINEVHNFDKLLINSGKTQLNCPPAPEPNDSHGGLLIRTLSENISDKGIALKREFKVHQVGVDADGKHKVEIREDVVSAPEVPGEAPVMSENRVVVSVVRT